MMKYRTEFKMKIIKENLEYRNSYKYLSDKYGIPNKCVIRKWVNAYKSQGYEGLKYKKKGRVSKIPKSPNKSEDIKIDSSANIASMENESLTQAQLKEKIDKLEEKTIGFN